MSLYTLMPAVNINDPEQCSHDLDKMKKLAEDFVTKYHSDCNEVVIVKIEIVGRMQYARPIFIDEPRQSNDPLVR